jgi:hypothetical protein
VQVRAKLIDLRASARIGFASRRDRLRIERFLACVTDISDFFL